MIEIRKTKEGVDRKPAKFGVFIDGNLIDGIHVNTIDIEGAEPYSLGTTTKAATELLLEYSFLELQKLGPSMLQLKYSAEWNEAIGNLWAITHDDETYFAVLVFSRIDQWHRSYSFAEYFRTLRQNVNQAGVTIMSIDDPVKNEFANAFPITPSMVTFPNLPKAKSLVSELSPLLHALSTIHKNVEQELESRFPIERVEVSFNFPEAVRVPCEQYLLYFSQFLKDLGVEATADLHHDAGKVLFSVLPGNKETALDNIRTALNTYLQLPSSPLNEDSILGIEEQRLAANVEHLRGQLRLAKATITAQQVTINLLENEVNPNGASSDALGELNKYGVEINYSEIFNRLKRIFGTRS